MKYTWRFFSSLKFGLFFLLVLMGLDRTSLITHSPSYSHYTHGCSHAHTHRLICTTDVPADLSAPTQNVVNETNSKLFKLMLHFCSEETSASVNPTKGIKKGKENKSATNVGWIPLVTGVFKSKHGNKTLSSHNLSFLLSDDSLEGFWGGRQGGVATLNMTFILSSVNQRNRSSLSHLPKNESRCFESVEWIFARDFGSPPLTPVYFVICCFVFPLRANVSTEKVHFKFKESKNAVCVEGLKGLKQKQETRNLSTVMAVASGCLLFPDWGENDLSAGHVCVGLCLTTWWYYSLTVK